jgi:hypothetical protein
VSSSAQPPAASRPANAGKKRQLVILGVLALLLVGGFGISWYLSLNNAGHAKVGDCMKRSGTNSVKIVGCSDKAAELKVVGRVEGKTQIESTIAVSSVCDPFRDKGAEQTYWEGKQGKKGFVLCLAKNTK